MAVSDPYGTAGSVVGAIVVLREHLAPVQWLAIACVVAASIGATRSGSGDHAATPGTLAS